jgi:hypothetical protein
MKHRLGLPEELTEEEKAAEEEKRRKEAEKASVRFGVQAKPVEKLLKVRRIAPYY